MTFMQKLNAPTKTALAALLLLTGVLRAQTGTAKTARDIATPLYSAGGGTAQAQTVTLAPPVPYLTAGLEVRWLPTAANTAPAPTLAVNGLSAISITKCGTAALVASDLTTTAVADAIYDGTEFQLLNPQASACIPRVISFQFGQPGGSALSTGLIGYITVPFACTITGWSIQADAGTDTVKFLKVAAGTAIPTLGSNSISTSGVSLSTGTVIQSSTVTDFTTTAVAPNDVVGVDLITTSGTGYINAQLVCQ
jgi:hypothetical protein